MAVEDPNFVPAGGIGSPDMIILDPDAMSHSITGLTPNSPYNVTVCASTVMGCGVVTSMMQITTQAGERDQSSLNDYHCLPF